jgi:hypothetical protein
VASFGQSLAADAWTHVAVTSSGGSLRLYVMGAQVATAPLTVSPHAALPLEIGNVGGCPQGADVVIDDVYIASRALSDAEIAAQGTPPPFPANLTATSPSTTQVDLAWDPVPDASLYIIYRDGLHFTTWPADQTTFSYNHLTAATTYAWQVRAVRGNLRSDFGPAVTMTTQGIPAGPTNVVATPSTVTGRIIVTWDTIPGANYHYVYQSVNGGPYAYLTTTYATPSLVVAGLTTGSTYSYQIQAITPVGVSDLSAPSAAVAAP